MKGEDPLEGRLLLLALSVDRTGALCVLAATETNTHLVATLRASWTAEVLRGGALPGVSRRRSREVPWLRLCAFAVFCILAMSYGWDEGVWAGAGGGLPGRDARGLYALFVVLPVADGNVRKRDGLGCGDHYRCCSGLFVWYFVLAGEGSMGYGARPAGRPVS